MTFYSNNNLNTDLGPKSELKNHKHQNRKKSKSVKERKKLKLQLFS